jgi:pimeloyl-ACP methyl ester carboxylesterase
MPTPVQRGVCRLAVVLSAGGLLACGDDHGATSRVDAGMSPDSGGSGGSRAPSFKSADCADVGAPADAMCGFVQVSEDHENPAGPTIELAVAVLKARSADAVDDPIVVLGGGPGSASIAMTLASWAPGAVPLWRKTRDVVLFDQRGAGKSKPNLNCPESDEALIGSFKENLSQADDIGRVVSGMKACHERLLDEGVDLGAYTTAQSARDVKDIVKVLGYDSYNLYAISYGTLLALSVLGDVPEGVRSVVLDSPGAIEADVSSPRDVEYGFEQLFAACKADPDCGERFPDVAQTMAETAAALDEHPITVKGTDPSGSTDPVEWIVTGRRYVLVLTAALSSTRNHHWVPQMIAEVARGELGLFGLFVNGFVNGLAKEDLAEGMAQSVICSEEFPFGGSTPGAKTGQADAPYDKVAEFDFEMKDTCAFWKTRAPDPKANEAVHSDLPALILAGSLDPILPSYYAAQVAGDLANSQYLLFERFGHGIVGSVTDEVATPRCAERITQAFFDAPTEEVDAGCRNDIPKTAW